MPREPENYRPYLEQIHQLYPDAVTLTKSQVAKIIGKSERTVQRNFHLVDGGTTAMVVARWLCKKYG